MADIGTRRAAGASLRVVAEEVGVSADSVRRCALVKQPSTDESPIRGQEQAAVLAQPLARIGERSAARAGLLQAAKPVFTPAGRVPLAERCCWPMMGWRLQELTVGSNARW